MSTDIWHVAEDSELADIRDENRLRVATAADFEDAQQIVAEHNSHSELLAALREIATADYTRIDVATLGNIARAAIAKATEVQS